MGIVETMKAKELKVVELSGGEKTWIGGVYMPPFSRYDEGSYEFVRCIRKEDITSKEIKTVTLYDTNGSYSVRYWTNLPEFWDKHAFVTEAPETVWSYTYNDDVFEHESVLDDWLAERAYGYYDDGFTEYSEGEFREKCDEYVYDAKMECTKTQFDEWYEIAATTKLN